MLSAACEKRLVWYCQGNWDNSNDHSWSSALTFWTLNYLIFKPRKGRKIYKLICALEIVTRSSYKYSMWERTLSELLGFVYNKGHHKSCETTHEIWRSEGELVKRCNWGNRENQDNQDNWNNWEDQDNHNNRDNWEDQDNLENWDNNNNLDNRDNQGNRDDRDNQDNLQSAPVVPDIPAVNRDNWDNQGSWEDHDNRDNRDNWDNWVVQVVLVVAVFPVVPVVPVFLVSLVVPVFHGMLIKR